MEWILWSGFCEGGVVRGVCERGVVGVEWMF